MNNTEYQGILRRTHTSEVYPDPGIRSTPASISLAEKLAYSATAAHMAGIDTLTFVQRSSGGYSFQSYAGPLTVSFPVLETITGDINFNSTSLASFSAPHLAMPHDNSVRLANTGLGAADVDALYNHLAIGLVGTTYSGTIDTSGTTANPTSASATARTALAAAGVTVTT